MQPRRLVALLSLVTELVVQRASADVLVYRGSYREFQPASNARVVTGKCFVIFQPPASSNETAGMAAFVRYFIEASGPLKGQKRYVTIAPEEVRFGGAQRPDDKVVRGLSHAEVSVIEPGFAHASYFFRGIQTAIPLKPGLNNTVITIQEPATLKGTAQSNAVTFLGGIYIERTFNLRQDVHRTLESNAGSLSISATQTNVVNYVKALGYQ